MPLYLHKLFRHLFDVSAEDTALLLEYVQAFLNKPKFPQIFSFHCSTKSLVNFDLCGCMPGHKKNLCPKEAMMSLYNDIIIITCSTVKERWGGGQKENIRLWNNYIRDGVNQEIAFGSGNMARGSLATVLNKNRV